MTEKTRGEKREAKRRKRGKHKVDGASVRLLHSIVMEKARKAAEEAGHANPRQ